ncbi:MAG: PhzF family phenazine biosynthesis protein [Firmicutes bacterium]|nr:PhzF family phenazine biosynthesis protein [Bacillota bacterium]
MALPFYQIDAFADAPFQGNPAAVMILEAWLPDATLQTIAQENNLAETAFVIPREGPWALRWFTPEGEIDLCGHATLASAHVAFHELGFIGEVLAFDTQSGLLHVRREDPWLVMDFPARPGQLCEAPLGLFEALGVSPRPVTLARDHMVVLDSEEDVRALTPDFRALDRVATEGVMVTAPGEEVDFVSRFFTPRATIPEDPVTGSAHCVLVPYWAERLGKTHLTARQLSPRGGFLRCVLQGDRVEMAGRAVKVLEGAFLV